MQKQDAKTGFRHALDHAAAVGMARAEAEREAHEDSLWLRGSLRDWLCGFACGALFIVTIFMIIYGLKHS